MCDDQVNPNSQGLDYIVFLFNKVSNIALLIDKLYGFLFKQWGEISKS